MAKANCWYGRDAPASPVDLRTSDLVHLATQALGNPLDPIPLRDVLKIVGQAPSPGGAMPKLLHRMVWPETGQPVDALIKFEKAGQGKHQDILVLEDWAYGVNERFGLPVPPRALLQDDHGNQILATTRFDRIEGRPVPCESLYSALKILNRKIFETPFTTAYQTEPNFPQVAQALMSPRTGMSADPSADGASMFSRIVLSFLTCNGDLHLKNTSILGARGEARLSPVYDPAPMRLYAAGDENLTAISFGGLRFFKSKIPEGFGAKLVELGIQFGLREARAKSVISDALDLTACATEEIAMAGAAENIVLAFGQLQGPVREKLKAAVLRNTHAGV